jgi:predicted Zn-dependent peptidase
MTQNSLRIFLTLILVTSICCASALAEKSTPLPQLSSKRLLNDLQVTVAATPYLGKDMAIGLVVRYGAAFDLAGKEGVANLVSRMLMKATLEKTFKDIQDELGYLESTIDVQCDWDGFRFVMRGHHLWPGF